MKQPGGKIRILGIAIPFAISLAILAGKPSSARAQLADSPWPMVYHDARHTSRSQYDTSANTGTVKWKFPLPYDPWYNTDWGPVTPPADPVIGADGTLYAGAGDGNIYAINQNGTEKWAFQTSNIILPSGPFATFSPAAIAADGTIYAGVSSAYGSLPALYALNADGSLEWLLGPDTDWWPTQGIAVGSDGTIYAPLEYGGFGGAEISPSGSVIGTYDAAVNYYQSSPAIGSDGTIYVRSLLGVSADPPLGPGWDYFTYDNCAYCPIIAPAIGSGGTIYVGVEWSNSSSNGLYAINSDGSQKWNYVPANGNSGWSTPAIGHDGTIYFGSVSPYATAAALEAVNPDGTGKWSLSFPAAVNKQNAFGVAIGSDGTIFTVPGDGSLDAVNSDGTIKWSVSVYNSSTPLSDAGPLSSAPTIGADGTVYVSSADGHLYAIGSTGAPPPTHAAVTPLVDFRNLPLGQTLIKSVTVRNIGAHPLIIAGVTSSDMDEFRPGESTCPAAGLAPQATCSISVTFQPATTGFHPAELSIADNAGDGIQRVWLSGYGGTHPHGRD